MYSYYVILDSRFVCYLLFLTAVRIWMIAVHHALLKVTFFLTNIFPLTCVAEFLVDSLILIWHMTTNNYEEKVNDIFFPLLNPWDNLLTATWTKLQAKSCYNKEKQNPIPHSILTPSIRNDEWAKF